MMERELSLSIYMEDDGSAEVVIYDNESGDSTSMTCDSVSIENGSFKDWLYDTVVGWVQFMEEELDYED